MVADTATGDIRELFEGLIPAKVIEAYDRLLASNGCAKDQAEALVGDAGLVAALTGWGWHTSSHTALLTRRGSAPPARIWRCKVSWPGTRTSWPTTRNGCWTATGGWLTRRPGSASA